MQNQIKLAKYYNNIYYKEDVYERESEFIISLIEKYKKNNGLNLIDVACGTGTHIKFFSKKYNVFGLDYSIEMLDIAKKCYPNIRFFHDNMISFQLNITFDIILCLFGSIAFVQNVDNLNKALSSFSNHLNPGGILILVPWSNTEDFKDKIVSDMVKKPEIKIVRMENVQRSKCNEVEITHHYLIGKDGQIKYLTGKSYIGLFSKKEYQKSIKDSGLNIVEIYESKEIQMGMAYICTK